MNSMNIRITAPDHLQTVSDFAEKMDLPLTKAVVLAVMLANKYQQTELENRALRQALASTQTVENDSINIAKNSIKNKTFNL